MSEHRRPLGAQQAFVDSSAYLAILDRKDQWHQQAVAILRHIISERYRQFTTNTIIIEAHALILSELGIQPAAQFLRNIKASNTAIIRVTEQDEQRAEAIIFQYDDKRYSYTDAISFAVMERLHITEAFTFDGNFAQHRLTVLTPP